MESTGYRATDNAEANVAVASKAVEYLMAAFVIVMLLMFWRAVVWKCTIQTAQHLPLHAEAGVAGKD